MLRTVEIASVDPSEELTTPVAPPSSVLPTALAKAADLSVRVVNDSVELARYVAAWQDLADNAMEANVFYEPWMLLPALEAFADGVKLRFVLVLEGDPHAPPEKARLCGFFPLQRRRLHPRLPFSILGMWQHLHCYYCAPLVRADAADATLKALFDWLALDSHGASVAEFNHLDAEGSFSRLLRSFCQKRDNPTVTADSFVRALLCTRGDGQEYLQWVFSNKRRRALKRKQQRLAECATPEYRTLEAEGEVERWIEEFLQLEAAGWKGRAGTALACDAANRRFFQAIFRAAFQRGRLFLCALRASGRPIAFRSSFLAGEGAFSFKITYDEQYAEFSPGALLEVENARRLHDVPGLRWMDSCAAPDHQMLNGLLPDRRTIHTVLAATGTTRGRFTIGLYRWLRALARRLQPSADSLSQTPSRSRRLLKALKSAGSQVRHRLHRLLGRRGDA